MLSKSAILSFLQQKCDVLFQQNNARPHTAGVTQYGLHGIQQLPWPVRTPYLSPIELVWDIMMRELTLSTEPPTTIAELRQRVQDAWDKLSRDDIRHL